MSKKVPISALYIVLQNLLYMSLISLSNLIFIVEARFPVLFKGGVCLLLNSKALLKHSFCLVK